MSETYTITQEQMDRLHGAAHSGGLLGGQAAYDGCLKVGAILSEIAFKEGFDKSPGSAPEDMHGAAQSVSMREALVKSGCTSPDGTYVHASMDDVLRAAQPPAAPVETDRLLQQAVIASGTVVQDHLPCSAATEQATGRYEFPYNRTFQAIAAATSVYAEGVGVNVSVKAFQEAFNSFPDARPLNEPQTLPESHLRALNEFVTLSEADYCSDDTEEGDWAEPDGEPVAAGQDYVSCVTFGSVRRAREAIDALLALSRPQHSPQEK